MIDRLQLQGLSDLLEQPTVEFAARDAAAAGQCSSADMAQTTEMLLRSTVRQALEDRYVQLMLHAACNVVDVSRNHHVMRANPRAEVNTTARAYRTNEAADPVERPTQAPKLFVSSSAARGDDGTSGGGGSAGSSPAPSGRSPGSARRPNKSLESRLSFIK